MLCVCKWCPHNRVGTDSVPAFSTQCATHCAYVCKPMETDGSYMADKVETGMLAGDDRKCTRVTI